VRCGLRAVDPKKIIRRDLANGSWFFQTLTVTTYTFGDVWEKLAVGVEKVVGRGDFSGSPTLFGGKSQRLHSCGGAGTHPEGRTFGRGFVGCGGDLGV